MQGRLMGKVVPQRPVMHLWSRMCVPETAEKHANRGRLPNQTDVRATDKGFSAARWSHKFLVCGVQGFAEFTTIHSGSGPMRTDKICGSDPAAGSDRHNLSVAKRS